MGDFLVKRDQLRECRIAESDAPEVAQGQALLRVESFGMTANNVTYAVLGDAMNYWDFFPAPEGWGRVPMWGFAEVAASEADGLEAGGRVYGYLPPSNHLLVEPVSVDDRSFFDGSEHRRPLPGAYQRYLLTTGDPFYEERYEDEQMLLRPLFFTSFLLDDDLGDGGLAGASTAILSSASSKTALGAAFLLAQRKGVEVIGLTSPRNAEFVEGLGIYDAVVPYDAVAELDPDSAAFVDVAGDAAVRGAVHRHLEGTLTASITVGASHWEALAADPGEMPGPAPRFFFAPDRVTKRSGDWGREGLEGRTAEAWAPFVEWVAGWLEVTHAEGLEAARDAYLEVLEGEVPPSRATVLRL